VGVGLSFLQRINPAWFLAGAAFFLPIKPAPVNLLLLIAMLAGLASAQVRKSLVLFLKHPVCISAFVLVLYLYLTAFYPQSDLHLAGDYATKYLRLLFIPVIAAILVNTDKPEKILDWFSLGVFLSVLASYGVILGYLQSELPTYFKAYLTHNFFVAVAATWVIYRITNSSGLAASMHIKLLLGFAVFISLVNLFVFIPGRSGWLTVLLIPFVLGFHFLGLKRGIWIAIALGIAAGVMFLSLDVIHMRVMQVFTEFDLWSSGSVQAKETSFGQRMLYWTISLEAIQHSPWFGYGLGGVASAVENGATLRNFEVFPNPHNQYLLLTLQGGVVALFMYFVFIGQVFKHARNQVVLWLTMLVYMVNNLINSFHYDFSESLLFVILIGLGLALSARRPGDQSLPARFS
jgi:O-antigen ligase